MDFASFFLSNFASFFIWYTPRMLKVRSTVTKAQPFQAVHRSRGALPEPRRLLKVKFLASLVIEPRHVAVACRYILASNPLQQNTPPPQQELGRCELYASNISSIFLQYGCGSKPMVTSWGRCTTHFSLLQWGLGCGVRAFGPWTYAFLEGRTRFHAPRVSSLISIRWRPFGNNVQCDSASADTEHVLVACPGMGVFDKADQRRTCLTCAFAWHGTGVEAVAAQCVLASLGGFPMSAGRCHGLLADAYAATVPVEGG